MRHSRISAEGGGWLKNEMHSSVEAFSFGISFLFRSFFFRRMTQRPRYVFLWLFLFLKFLVASRRAKHNVSISAALSISVA